ncbi:MAG TPA: hypothetical protein P5556_09585 [Candidatus Gastranaerophilales bacterium]|nr:hypothetical protein [Candidatus Gastranaerophilales bacterium]
MHFFDSPLYKKEDPLNKLLLDTEEIIKNFKEISENIAKKPVNANDSKLYQSK